MNLRAAVIESFPAVSEMLAVILAQEGGYQSIRQMSSGLDALRFFENSIPDLVVLDLVLPETSGLEVLRFLRTKGRPSRVVIFTATDNRALISDALAEQPHGFVHKKDSLDVLREALQAVRRGQTYYAPFVTSIMDERRESSPSSWDGLSQRERSVVQMVAEGMTSREMASRMFLSTRTVESYRIKAMKKLKLRNVVEITRYALRQGLVSLE